MTPVPTTLSYRPAQGRKDAEMVDHLQCVCGAEITARLGVGHWTRASNVTAIVRGFATRDTFLVFAGNEKEAIGSFTVREKMPPFFPPSLWRVPTASCLGVFGLAVLPLLQRQGIGTWMMRQIEGIASERSLRFVRLDAYEANPFSVAFYRKLGYEERGRLVVGGVPLLCFEMKVAPSHGVEG